LPILLGHLYAGIFVQHIPWQGLFWVNVPLSLFALVVVLYALRNVPQHRAEGRFDWLGALLLIGALVTFNIGLGGANIDVSVSTSIDNLAVLPQSATWLLPLSALLLGLFIFVEGRVRDPLIDLKLFRSRNLSAGSLTNLFVG